MFAPLAPLYVIHGEEELLRLEYLDKLRVQAKAQGYTHREVHTVDSPQFDWQTMLTDAASVSLFADLKWLEIHIPNGKTGKQGSEALQYLAQNLPADTVVVIVLPKLEKAQTQSKWFGALTKQGSVYEAKAITVNALPEWIKQRLYQHRLLIDDDALALFAERVEGNLLAAKQEVDKLALLYAQGHTLTLDETEQSVANVARFDVFQLSAAWMSGDAARLLRLLEGLEAEDDAPILPLWALVEDIRVLMRLSAALKQGKTAQSVRQELKLWGDKIHHAPKAAARLSANRLIAALQECAAIDRQIKGAEVGNAWASLKQLLISLTH